MENKDETIDEMELAVHKATAFILSKKSYELLHKCQVPGYLSQEIFETMQNHGKIMEAIVKGVDEFKDIEAVKTFKDLIGIKDKNDQE